MEPKIEEAVNNFCKLRSPYHRFASYDYCYNCFYLMKDNPEKLICRENIEKSCLYLMNYLASWGMLRGSSFLLQKNVKFFENLVRIILDYKKLWGIDVDIYSEGNIESICNFYDEVQKQWAGEKNVTEALITKILMGIFGCTPAFDNYFEKRARNPGYTVSKYFKKRLKETKKIYEDYKSEIDLIKIKTLDFGNGRTEFPIYYKKAKIIDMFLW